MSARLRFAVLALAIWTASSAQVRGQLPTSPQTDNLLLEGHSLYDAGRYKEAAASFERAMQLGVARPHEAAWEVARSYARLGNRKQAQRWEEIAVRLGYPSGVAKDAARPLPFLVPALPVWRARLT